MAINFIYGPPGGGKTYYAVNHLLSKFFYWDKKREKYFLKREHKNIKIVTNIDEFSPKHYSLHDWIYHAGSSEKFFSYDTQEKVFEKNGPIVYMIDECHEFFPSTLKNQEVFRWLSYHRHWGQTIYLMSQSHSAIPRRITDMLELTVYALPRSSSLLGGKDLKYNFMSGREIVDRKALIKSQRIFDQYKSQHAEEKLKTKNPLIKYIVGCTVIAVLLIGNALRWASGFGERSPSSQTAVAATSIENQSATSINVRPLEVKEPPKKIAVGVSWAKFKTNTVIFFQEKMYPIKDFPYPVTFNGLGDMVALIPADHFPQPTNNPQQAAQPSSPERGQARSRYQIF
jgi:hypothetical protein